jgi:hypothetical protein
VGTLKFEEVPKGLREKYKFRWAPNQQFGPLGSPLQVKVSYRQVPGYFPVEWIWVSEFPSYRAESSALLKKWKADEQKGAVYYKDIPSIIDDISPPPPTGGGGDGSGSGGSGGDGSGGDGSGGGSGSGDDQSWAGVFGTGVYALSQGLLLSRRRRGVRRLPTRRSQVPDTTSAGVGSTLAIVGILGAAGIGTYFIASQ